MKLSTFLKSQFIAVSIIGLLVVGCRNHNASISVIPINHPHDNVLHGWYVEDLIDQSLDRHGEKNVSVLLNLAISELFKKGGGTLYLPAGKYRLDKPIYIPPGVALRGDFVVPGTGKVSEEKNTIICAYYGREMNEQAPPLILLDGSGLIDGMVIWYPEQSIDNVTSYAPTIRHTEKMAQWAINSASRNLFLVNPYTGIQLGKKGKGTCIQLMKNIYGTPLSNGIEVWRDADIPRILNLEFNPDFWPNSGLDYNPIDTAKLNQYLIENAAGITYHRCDGSELSNITIRGYNKGLQLKNGHQMKNGFWLDNEGHYINFKITDCYYAVWIENIKNHGTQFYNSVLNGRHSAVYINNPMHYKECAMFMGCELSGGKAAVSQKWEAKKNEYFSLMFSACTFKSPIKWSGGNLSVVDSEFTFKGPHITIGPDTNHAIIADNRFEGVVNIENHAGKKAIISHSDTNYIDYPKYIYDPNIISSYHPPRIESAIITPEKEIFDDAIRIQKVIDRLSSGGGGYVVLLPGIYQFDSPLVIKKNVEIRGTIQSWQHSKTLSYFSEKDSTKGTIIFMKYGKGLIDKAAITIEENAGIDGLFFHYPDQAYNSTKKTVAYKYSWLIRIKGNRGYVKHVTASNPWQFLDIFTYTPKDTYVGYCVGAPLKQGLHVGEADNCMVDNVHFNSWYWNTVYYPNQPGENPITGFKEELDNWMKANTLGYVFSGSTNLNVYGSFIFCAKQGFTLKRGDNSGKGPNGIIINSGNDWSKYGLYMYANNGLKLANMHFIDVGKYDTDQKISSIYVDKRCKDSISLYNVSTWGESPRTLSLHGSPESKTSIYNFSYQLHPEQFNIISGGKVRIVNSIRNYPERKTNFEVSSSGQLELHANLYPNRLNFNNTTQIPASVKWSSSFPVLND